MFYAGSATTKTLKNYVRAMHMFLFKGIEGFQTLGNTQDDIPLKQRWTRWHKDDKYKNLTKLGFGGEGVLTYVMKKLKSINTEVQNLLNGKTNQHWQQVLGKDKIIAGLEQQVERLRTENQEIETLREQTQEIATLQVENKKIKDEMESMKKENEKLTEENGTLLTDSANQPSQQDEIDRLKEEITTLNAKIQEQQREIENQTSLQDAEQQVKNEDLRI
jgi:chromosome segregation ATPase